VSYAPSQKGCAGKLRSLSGLYVYNFVDRLRSTLSKRLKGINLSPAKGGSEGPRENPEKRNPTIGHCSGLV